MPSGLTCLSLRLSPRSAFTMHVEAGHSAVPEEGPKDLRCPLCLYHTKYKRNMIDHIVLHRGNLPDSASWRRWREQVALSRPPQHPLPGHSLLQARDHSDGHGDSQQDRNPSLLEGVPPFLHPEGGKGLDSTGNVSLGSPSVRDPYILSPLPPTVCLACTPGRRGQGTTWWVRAALWGKDQSDDFQSRRCGFPRNRQGERLLQTKRPDSYEETRCMGLGFKKR